MTATPPTNAYTEDLTVQRLGANHVGARFVFRSRWTPESRHRCQNHEDWNVEFKSRDERIKDGKLCHFDAMFPRAMGVLLDRFKVRDLSLHMSKGRWDTAVWGNGPSGEYTPGGAEMWARLPVDGSWESWVGLRRSLSGLYCASLDAMDETRVHGVLQMAMPGDSFAPRDNGTVVLRGTLPREPVCTENLIPLVKMLPCRSKTGLGSLLHPTRLFKSDYHSVAVRARAEFSSDDGSITSLSLEQSVLAVFRPRPHLPSPTASESNSSPPRDTTPAALQQYSAAARPEDWSLISLLLPPTMAAEWLDRIKNNVAARSAARSSGPRFLERCPIASHSAIHVLDNDVIARVEKRRQRRGPGPGTEGYHRDDGFGFTRKSAVEAIADGTMTSSATAAEHDAVSGTTENTCDAGSSQGECGACANAKFSENGGEAEGRVSGTRTRLLLPSQVGDDAGVGKERGGTIEDFLISKLWGEKSNTSGSTSSIPAEKVDSNAGDGARQLKKNRAPDPIIPEHDPRRETNVPDDDHHAEDAGRTAESARNSFRNSDGFATPTTRVCSEELREGSAEAASWGEAVARVDHFLAGRGGTRGVSVSHLINAHPTADALVDLLQPVPYFMIPLWRTLRARLVPLEDEGQSSSAETAPPTPPRAIIQENISNDLLTNRERTRQTTTTKQLVNDVVQPLFGERLSLAENVTLTPGDGRRPAVLEAQLWVPAGSTLVLGFDFFKRFLALDDFPPDPSRGFDVPAPLARFSFFCPFYLDADQFSGRPGMGPECGLMGEVKDGLAEPADGRPQAGGVAFENRGAFKGRNRRNGGSSRVCDVTRVVYAYGEAGLLDTPQPDFSMPFNVITFTSTVITFFLGTAINLLVRKSAVRGRRRQDDKKQDARDGAGKGEQEHDGKRQETAGGILRRAWRRWRSSGRGGHASG